MNEVTPYLFLYGGGGGGGGSVKVARIVLFSPQRGRTEKRLALKSCITTIRFPNGPSCNVSHLSACVLIRILVITECI